MPIQVDGLINSKEIADNFALQVEKSCSIQSKNGSERLSQLGLYETQRSNYVGSPGLKEHHFDAELVERIRKEKK